MLLFKCVDDFSNSCIILSNSRLFPNYSRIASAIRIPKIIPHNSRKPNVYTCVYVHVYACKCIVMCRCVCIHMFVHLCVCVCMYTRICVCVQVCICVLCVHVCVRAGQ